MSFSLSHTPLRSGRELPSIALAGAAFAVAGNYSHVQPVAVRAFNSPFELRVTAQATDDAGKRLFPDMAGSRVEAAVQASF